MESGVVTATLPNGQFTQDMDLVRVLLSGRGVWQQGRELIVSERRGGRHRFVVFAMRPGGRDVFVRWVDFDMDDPGVVSLGDSNDEELDPVAVDIGDIDVMVPGRYFVPIECGLAALENFLRGNSVFSGAGCQCVVARMEDFDFVPQWED